GLAPALRTTRPQLAPELKVTAGAAGFVRRSRLGLTLVAAQLALSLVLLTGAALLLRTLIRLGSVDLGFDPDHVIVFRVESVAALPPEQPRKEAYRRLLQRAEAFPGVGAASLSFFGLFGGATWGNSITVEGYVRPPDEEVRTFANAVSARYFEVLRLPLVRGRSFGDRDDDRAPPVAIVNEAFAAKFFGSVDPVGKRVGLGRPTGQMREIVGVVRNARYQNRKESPRTMLYVPYAQYAGNPGELEVRTAAEPLAIAASLRRELAAADPSL